MRTPQRLTTAGGETYYRVRFRMKGMQKAASFYGPTGADDAREFVRLLDALGAERAVAWWNANLDAEHQGGMTLDEWWDRYFGALTGLTDGTRTTYDRIYRRVWRPALGSLPLTAITREDIARVINQLSATRSDKTVKNAYGIIATCFKVAVADGHLAATPCARIRLPRRTEHTETEMRFLTHAEWAQLYDHLPRHYRPLFMMLMGTGMRWGEAEALTVADVVLGADPVVRVNKAAKWDASTSQREVGPTKTRRSRRTITLPAEVVAEITPLLDRRGHERLFLAPRGGPLRHRTVYDEWKKAVERTGLVPQPRIHDLRHSHVSWLIAAGVPLPVIQARLGHESIKTTVDRYGHLLPDLQRAAADAASLAMRSGGQAPALAAPPATPGEDTPTG